MTQPMTLTHRLGRLEPGQMPVGPATGVALSSSGLSPQERFRRLLPPDRVPARTPLVLLWRGEPLSSADTVAVMSVNQVANRIALQIELRRFDGPLHANVVTVPVVEVDLGPLEPGQYDVSVELTELSFSEYDHPENATNASTQHADFSFVVV